VNLLDLFVAFAWADLELIVLLPPPEYLELQQAPQPWLCRESVDLSSVFYDRFTAFCIYFLCYLFIYFFVVLGMELRSSYIC
jgi:hypothetical protein